MAKIIIKNQKASAIHFNGNFYDTNREIEVPFTDALRMGKIATVEIVDKTIEKYNPLTFTDNKNFTFVSDIDSVSGWGNVSLNLIKYSSDEFKPSLLGRLLDVHDPRVIRSYQKPIDPESALIIHEQPKEYWYSIPFERKIAIVPFETTVIPKSWIGRINSCSALLVPCQQNVDAFRGSGVTIPIEIIHWGIDTDKFYPLERTSDRPFTFGTMGALSKRKGTDILVEAFQKAFPTETDVKLICKSSFNGYPFMVKDKRIQVDLTPVTHDELLNNFFKKVDCFVFPTRGEGFGLTPLEAMATGIPSIVTGWSGPVEYMTPETGWLIDYTMTPAKDFTDSVYKEECGDWAEPSLDHLVKLMRYAYEHQDEVKEKGKNASKHVEDSWTWEKKIPMFKDALKKHLK